MDKKSMANEKGYEIVLDGTYSTKQCSIKFGLLIAVISLVYIYISRYIGIDGGDIGKINHFFRTFAFLVIVTMLLSKARSMLYVKKWNDVMRSRNSTTDNLPFDNKVLVALINKLNKQYNEKGSDKSKAEIFELAYAHALFIKKIKLSEIDGKLDTTQRM